MKKFVAQKFTILSKKVKVHWLELALTLVFFGNIRSNGTVFNGMDFQQMEFISAQQLFSSLFETDSTVASIDTSNLANTYSNLIYTEQGIETKDPSELRRIKRIKQKHYVTFYAPIAQEEMRTHGIPASITLAQGLLESNVGESKLAQRNYNHFGIKCFSKTCQKGHCSNFEDDTHKDFFRIFKTPEESYKAHSKLLQKTRYKFLFDLDQTDYKNWAHGLKKAGYATDPKYGYKIVNLIEDLKLYEYDNLKDSKEASTN